MPTQYQDQFLVIDALDPPPVGSDVNKFFFDIVDANDSGVIGGGAGDTINGIPIDESYDGETIQLNVNGTVIEYVGVSFIMADGQVFFTPTDGQVLKSGTFVDSSVTNLGPSGVRATDLGAPCFTPGTLIETASGPRAVETLRAGDMVLTRDAGAQPVRLVAQRHLHPRHLRTHPAHQPVRICRGTLGPNQPSADLIVSPEHRILVQSRIAQRMFGAEEVLVAARQLLALPGIEIADDLKEITYIHLLFDRHHIVTSNGAATESLFTGAEALKSVGPAVVREISELFPELIESNGTAPTPARPIAQGRRARHLAQRHIKDGKTLVGNARVAS